jgi:hypothetical protein
MIWSPVTLGSLLAESLQSTVGIPIVVDLGSDVVPELSCIVQQAQCASARHTHINMRIALQRIAHDRSQENILATVPVAASNRQTKLESMLTSCPLLSRQCMWYHLEPSWLFTAQYLQFAATMELYLLRHTPKTMSGHRSRMPCPV